MALVEEVPQGTASGGVIDKLSHYDKAGRARMVDVSAKVKTLREAVAEAFVESVEDGAEGSANEPQGQPAGSGADCGDSGGQADGGANSDVPSAGVELCGCRGDGGCGRGEDSRNGGDNCGDGRGDGGDGCGVDCSTDGLRYD